MPQNPDNVVNPDLVDVADQGDGLLAVDQPVTTGPSQNPGSLVAAASLAPGVGEKSPDQPVTVTPAMTAGRTVEGGTASPQSPNTENVISNNVIDQVYGTGAPTDVYV